MDTMKLKEVFSDKAYIAQLFRLGSAEQIQSSLKEKGLDMTIEECNALYSLYESRMSGSSELSPEVLEQVAGGGWFSNVLHFLRDIVETVFTACGSNAPGSRFN